MKLAKLTDQYGRAIYIAPDTVSLLEPKMIVASSGEVVDGTQISTAYGLLVEVVESIETVMMALTEGI